MMPVEITKTIGLLRQRITELGRIEKSGSWSRREIAEFKKVYGTRTDQDLARIFDPYFTTKPKGTGLGLFIANKIIEQHGGTIKVDSKPNRGSSFRISLPQTPPGAD